MGEPKLWKDVREVVLRIIKDNLPYYSEDLLATIPEELLDKELTEANIIETMLQLDGLRFKKEKEMAALLGILEYGSETSEEDLEKIDSVVNCENPESLPPEQSGKISEIKFLFNVSGTVVHY